MSSILLATVSLDSGTAPSLAAALSPIIILHMSCAAGKMRVSAIVCGLPSLPILLAKERIQTLFKARQGKFIYIAHFIHSGNSKCFT